MAKATKSKTQGAAGKGMLLDFSGVKDSPIPDEGEHTGTIKKSEAGVSKTEQPVLRLEIELDDGQEVYDYISLQPQALFKLRALMQATGMEDPAGQKMSVDFSKFRGKRVGLVIKHELYNHRPYAKVAQYVAAGDIDFIEGEEM